MVLPAIYRSGENRDRNYAKIRKLRFIRVFEGAVTAHKCFAVNLSGLYPMQHDTETLLAKVADGDSSAANVLFERYRPRIRTAVQIRIDDRVAGRFDPSDVVQDALVQAGKRLREFARDPKIPFYPWLRRIAIDRLLDLHRRHLDAARRTVKREISADLELSNASHRALAKRLVSRDRDTSEEIQERRELVQSLIEQLSESDREVLVLRYLEQATNKDAAAILGISENSFAQRHVRALRRVRKMLDESENSDE